jgi:hypothetical protein
MGPDLNAGLGHSHMAALPAVVTGAMLQSNSEKSIHPVSVRHTKIESCAKFMAQKVM